MTASITRLALALAALCVAAAAPAQEAPVIIGAVVSRTGAHADLADGYRQGLLLWEAELNAAGGLLGRPVVLRLLDDGSSAAAAGRQYERLVAERADLLIGPYGSAATLMAAAVAERAKRIMVNGAGPAGAVHKRAPQYVFQSVAPYASYGMGVLELAREAGLERLLVLSRDDPRSQEMAEATLELARERGLSVNGEVVFYPSGTEDFAPQVAIARAAQAEAWIAFGEVFDAADMLRSFKRLGYAPRLFFARAATDPRFIALVGQDAEFSLGAIEYHPRLATPGNERFVRAFEARWKATPGPAAAEGYAAGTVLEAAVRRAGSLDQEALRAALAELELPTVLGRYKVDPRDGRQTGIVPAVAQIRRGIAEALWPETLARARLAPYPAWNERVLLE